jgi:hypothetical protein
MIIYSIIQFLNNMFATLFYFAPDILCMFALSIFILDIGKYLEQEDTKKAKILKYIIDGLYLIYVFFRMIPFGSLSFSYNTLAETISSIMAILPYVAVILLGKILAQYKIVHYLLNYYTMHLYYIIFSAIYFTLNPTPNYFWDGVFIVVLAGVVSSLFEIKKRY